MRQTQFPAIRNPSLRFVSIRWASQLFVSERFRPVDMQMICKFTPGRANRNACRRRLTNTCESLTQRSELKRILLTKKYSSEVFKRFKKFRRIRQLAANPDALWRIDAKITDEALRIETNRYENGKNAFRKYSQAFVGGFSSYVRRA